MSLIESMIGSILIGELYQKIESDSSVIDYYDSLFFSSIFEWMTFLENI